MTKKVQYNSNKEIRQILQQTLEKGSVLYAIRALYALKTMSESQLNHILDGQPCKNNQEA